MAVYDFSKSIFFLCKSKKLNSEGPFKVNCMHVFIFLKYLKESHHCSPWIPSMMEEAS